MSSHRAVQLYNSVIWLIDRYIGYWVWAEKLASLSNQGVSKTPWSKINCVVSGKNV